MFSKNVGRNEAPQNHTASRKNVLLWDKNVALTSGMGLKPSRQKSIEKATEDWQKEEKSLMKLG